jgi:hypothetical protein
MAVEQKDIAHGVELQGVYDGICYWVMKDGSYVNRFSKTGRPRQWQMVEEHLAELRAADEREHDV